MFRKFSAWFHYTFKICSYCHIRKAKWMYMPGIEMACEKCVPRGCMCNLEPKDPNNYDEENPNDWYQPLDDKGREYPCCEWMEVDD